MNDFLSAAKNLQVKEIATGFEEIAGETSNESNLDDLHALPKQTIKQC